MILRLNALKRPIREGGRKLVDSEVSEIGAFS